MHDIDPPGGDQPLQPAGISAQSERIDAVMRKRNPVYPGRMQGIHQRSAPTCDDGAGAGFLQRERQVERRPRPRFVVKSGGQEENDRAGKPPHGRQGNARFIAHAAKSRWSPWRYPLALTPACGETDPALLDNRMTGRADRCESGR